MNIMKGHMRLASLIPGLSMLLVLLAALASLSVATPACAQTPICVTPPSGLVHWWPADGNANDIIGGNTGTLHSGVTFAPGEVGQAFSLDGSNDAFVEVLATSNLNIPGSLTVDAWIKLDELRPFGVHNIVSKENSSLPLNVNYNLHVLNNRLFFALTFSSPSDQTTITVSGTGACDPGGCYVTGSTDLDTTNFHHVAGVYDDSTKTMSVYLDGVLDGTATFSATGSPTTNNANLRIGKRNAYSDGTALKGRIDEVEIFNVALSESDIKAIYLAGSAGKCRTCTQAPSNLVSWWPGDGNANDITGGNNGTLNGDATFATGMVGQGFSFPAFSYPSSESWVSIPSSDSLNITQAITLDAWIKADTFDLPLSADTSDANIYVKWGT